MNEEPKMAQLNVEIPDDLKRTIKSTAARDGVSMQTWIISALRDYTNSPVLRDAPASSKTIPAERPVVEIVKYGKIRKAAK
jgi:hypothetical protein